MENIEERFKDTHLRWSGFVALRDQERWETERDEQSEMRQPLTWGLKPRTRRKRSSKETHLKWKTERWERWSFVRWVWGFLASIVRVNLVSSIYCLKQPLGFITSFLLDRNNLVVWVPLFCVSLLFCDLILFPNIWKLSKFVLITHYSFSILLSDELW